MSGLFPAPLPLLATVLAGAPVILLIAQLLGGIATNQTAAIATIKVLMPLYLTVPLLSLFIADRWQPLLYPFPNYWLFQALQHVFETVLARVEFVPALGLALVSGVAYTLGSSAVLGPRLGFRR